MLGAYNIADPPTRTRTPIVAVSDMAAISVVYRMLCLVRLHNSRLIRPAWMMCLEILYAMYTSKCGSFLALLRCTALHTTHKYVSLYYYCQLNYLRNESDGGVGLALVLGDQIPVQFPAASPSLLHTVPRIVDR